MKGYPRENFNNKWNKFSILIPELKIKKTNAPIYRMSVPALQEKRNEKFKFESSIVI